jgi:hypothetical protein
VDVVSLAHYQGQDGFGIGSFQDIEQLNKALTAGSGTDSSAFSGGRSLTVESLEQTLMTTTYSMEDIVLFKLLKSNPIFGVN